MSEALSAESALCTSCGLCCTGALHDRAALHPDELEDAATIGLPVRTSPTPTRLRMFALSTYLDRHFRKRNEGTILKQETCS